jgi:hypothetical protein
MKHAFLATVMLALGCGGARTNDCDPTMIVVKDKCFWDKDRACDELGCLPPNECVELDGSPPQVECRKPQ